LAAQADPAVNDVRPLCHEGRSAAVTAAVVAGRDAVAADVGFDTIEHRDKAVRLFDDGDRDSASDTETVARS
jgi:hypothetical protein